MRHSTTFSLRTFELCRGPTSEQWPLGAITDSEDAAA